MVRDRTYHRSGLCTEQVGVEKAGGVRNNTLTTRTHHLDQFEEERSCLPNRTVQPVHRAASAHIRTHASNRGWVVLTPFGASHEFAS
jgi:hypothetical protein